MNQAFCSQCGVRLVPDARFCIECGEPTGQAAPARRAHSLAWARYSPWLVVAATLVVAGGAIWFGSLSAKQAPNVPSRDAGPASGMAMPEGHPPVTLPADVKDKIAALAKEAEAHPEELEKWKTLALAQYRAGQFEPEYLSGAMSSYEHILEREPNNLEALRGLGNIAFDQEQPQKAIEYYEKYLALEPKDPSVRTDMGTMYLSAKDTLKAIEAYQQVVADEPKFFQAHFNLAIAHRTAGNLDEAAAALQKAREVAPDEATRKLIDQLLGAAAAPASDGAAPQTASAPAASSAGSEAPSGFQSGVESIFREEPIVAAKLDRVEWSSDGNARVLLRNFPMDAMPPEVHTMFTDRIRNGLKERKAEHQINAAVRIDLVDSATGRVMHTVSE